MHRKARVVRCYANQPLQAESELTLDKRSAHHLSTVLRSRVGQAIVLFNGDGKNYAGELTSVGKKTCVKIDTVTDNPTESKLNITLVQAIARGDKMDSIVRQVIELGANAIQPIYTKQSIAKLDDKRALKKSEHWQSIVISACEQSARSTLPTVHPIMTLDAYLQSCQAVTNNQQRWVLSPSATTLENLDTNASDITLMIGPESGFDPDEIIAAESRGFTALQLGQRVMRTETAGPAVVAAMQTRFGDFG